MSTAARSDAAGMRLRVLLPDDIATRYQREADDRAVDIETLLSDRLVRCVTHTAEKPIYFSDAARQELEQLLGKNISSMSILMTLIRNAVTVKVEGVKIALKPSLLSRLKTRCLGMEWGAFLEKIIVEDLERYVGMR